MDAANQPGQQAPSRLRRWEWALATALTVAIVGGHVYFWRHVGGFWRDEVNTFNLASRPSLAAMAQDSFPVLMPLLLHGWMALGLGRTDAEVRLLGLGVGLGILAAIWFAGWKIHRSPPLLLLALLGANATLIVYGDALRAYGLGSLFILLAVTGAIAFLRKPSWSRALGLALLFVLSVQTLYHNAILVGAICAGAMAVCLRQRNGKGVVQIFAAGTIAAMTLLPYVPMLIGARDTAAVVRTGATFSRLYGKFSDCLGFPFQFYILIWVLLALATVIRGFSAGKRPNAAAATEMPNSDLNLFAAVTLPVALAGFSAFLLSAALSIQSWYLLPLLALMAACFEISFHSLARLPRAIVIAFVTVSLTLAVPVGAGLLQFRFSNMDLRVRELTAMASPGDYIIVLPWFCGISFDHYFHGTTPWDTLPPVADHATHRYDLVKVELENTNALQPVLARAGATLRAGHRVFILADGGWMSVPDPRVAPPAGLPPAPLPGSGWSELPYTEVWASQLKHFLAGRGTGFVKIHSPTERFPFAERMELFRVDGAKTNSP